MRAKFLVLIVVIAMVLLMVVPAMAITDGELDGNGHPYVGLMVAQDADGNPLKPGYSLKDQEVENETTWFGRIIANMDIENERLFFKVRDQAGIEKYYFTSCLARV